jgi:hypothetical protein
LVCVEGWVGKVLVNRTGSEMYYMCHVQASYSLNATPNPPIETPLGFSHFGSLMILGFVGAGRLAKTKSKSVGHSDRDGSEPMKREAEPMSHHSAESGLLGPLEWRVAWLVSRMEERALDEEVLDSR